METKPKTKTFTVRVRHRDHKAKLHLTVTAENRGHAKRAVDDLLRCDNAYVECDSGDPFDKYDHVLSKWPEAHATFVKLGADELAKVLVHVLATECEGEPNDEDIIAGLRNWKDDG